MFLYIVFLCHNETKQVNLKKKWSCTQFFFPFTHITCLKNYIKKETFEYLVTIIIKWAFFTSWLRSNRIYIIHVTK